MKRLALLSAGVACLAIPALSLAQAPPPFPLTGMPPGAEPLKNANTTGFPAPNLVPGQPIETRPPELAGDTPAFPLQTRAPYRKTVAPKVTLITDLLKSPWSVAFLPGGKFLITEKPGALRIVSADGKISDPVKGVPAVNYGGQVGLLDVALDARFAANKRIFFSYSEPVPPNGDMTNIALASAVLDEAGLTLSNVRVIFRVTPALPKALMPNEGGRIAVAKDGSLFMTTGDRSRSPPWEVAQRLDTTLGKVIHVTVDGKPAPGNPFIGKAGAMPEIWSVGHRSEEGLAFDTGGRLWETEHGPRGGDELNLIEAGKNYGWPVTLHGIDYPGETLGGGATTKAGTEQARYYWDPVIAPSGLAFYRGNLFPQWKDSVFVGALRGTMLDRLTIVGGKVVDEEPLLVDMKARIRDVRVTAEGVVYVLSDDGKFLKLTPN